VRTQFSAVRREKRWKGFGEGREMDWTFDTREIDD
jgi:hypothetical protein